MPNGTTSGLSGAFPLLLVRAAQRHIDLIETERGIEYRFFHLPREEGVIAAPCGFLGTCSVNGPPMMALRTASYASARALPFLVQRKDELARQTMRDRFCLPGREAAEAPPPQRAPRRGPADTRGWLKNSGVRVISMSR